MALPVGTTAVFEIRNPDLPPVFEPGSLGISGLTYGPELIEESLHGAQFRATQRILDGPALPGIRDRKQGLEGRIQCVPVGEGQGKRGQRTRRHGGVLVGRPDDLHEEAPGHQHRLLRGLDLDGELVQSWIGHRHRCQQGKDRAPLLANEPSGAAHPISPWLFESRHDKERSIQPELTIGPVEFAVERNELGVGRDALVHERQHLLAGPGKAGRGFLSRSHPLNQEQITDFQCVGRVNFNHSLMAKGCAVRQGHIRDFQLKHMRAGLERDSGDVHEIPGSGQLTGSGRGLRKSSHGTRAVVRHHGP